MCGRQPGPEEWGLLFSELGSLALSGQQASLAGCPDFRAQRLTTPEPPRALYPPICKSRTPTPHAISSKNFWGKKESMQQCQLT